MPDQPCDLCDERAHTYLGDGSKLCDLHYDEATAWKRAVEDQALIEMGGPLPQRCPRRDEMFQQGGPPEETPDEWRFGHGIITNELILTCNYCGSVHPDVFTQKMREGWTWGCTDKDYKAYLGKPDGSDVGKFYFQHLSAEQRRELIEMVNAGRIAFGPSGLYRLPFFMTRAT